MEGDKNYRINQKLREILGITEKFIKRERFCESESSAKKLGRGRWNQVPDDKYAFNVSYANGDTVISMGKIFII